ncbi:FAD-binding oxidoreductase [Paucibacter sp. B2R-40]|uniref:FAD-binding oxidoreductase n=1 Tax=Paucibacter sp. B2R-40 TaxID=2893554 RepID=UPI0021E3D0AA|nr:FAD-binding oxidoreductase [Paucibacter sp. B2R-40]MCV2354518.1 FAD-binding oxidoreductase [Paucibacter sp. B2R-40]
MNLISTTNGEKFDARDGETLLDAATRGGVALGYSCRTGRCSSCKGLVRSGSTIAVHDELGLTAAERDAGWILTCVRHASSNVELDIESLGDIQLFPAKTTPCRIHSLERLSADVIKVVLRLPPTSDFCFHPGQYIDVIGADGLRRSYSVANAPNAAKQIELHIREVAGGAMSRYWFEQAKVNDLLRFNGPLGTFFLRDTAGKDLVFLATGTGMAPVKAMLEGLRNSADDANKPRSVSVYWGGRSPQDFYWDPASLAPGFVYVPVLSRAEPDWPGARGHVQDALLASTPDLTQTVVYACGSDAMIHSAREQLIANGLPDKCFHSDAFVCSASN